MSSAPGAFLQSASGENPRDLSAHTNMYKNMQKWLCVTCDHHMIWWINSWSLDSGLDHSYFAQVKTLKLSQHNPCIKSSIFHCKNTALLRSWYMTRVSVPQSILARCLNFRQRWHLKAQPVITIYKWAYEMKGRVCITICDLVLTFYFHYWSNPLNMSQQWTILLQYFLNLVQFNSLPYLQHF